MGRAGIRRRKPRQRFPKTTVRLPRLPDTDSKYVWLPDAGGPILASPGRWLKALRYGTRRQRLRAIPIAFIVALAVGAFAVAVFGGTGILILLAVAFPILGLAFLSWRLASN